MGDLENRLALCNMFFPSTSYINHITNAVDAGGMYVLEGLRSGVHGIRFAESDRKNAAFNLAPN